MELEVSRLSEKQEKRREKKDTLVPRLRESAGHGGRILDKLVKRIEPDYVGQVENDYMKVFSRADAEVPDSRFRAVTLEKERNGNRDKGFVPNLWGTNGSCNRDY